MHGINDNGAIKGLDAREDGVYITYSAGADTVTKKLGSDVSFSVEIKVRAYMNDKPTGWYNFLTYKGECTIINGVADLKMVSNDSAFKYPTSVSQHVVIDSVRIYDVREI